MKSILLPLTAELDVDGLSNAACRVAKSFDARLTALFVRHDPHQTIPILGEGLTAEMVQNMCDAVENESLQQTKLCEARVTAAASVCGIKISDDETTSAPSNASMRWCVAVGKIQDHVGRSARTADFSICARPDGANTPSREIFNDLIFRSGRSVLMLPDSNSEAHTDHILIAWNGRAECARAVTGAMPLLAKAKKITIIQVGDIGEDRPGLEEIGRYMRDHQVKVELVSEEMNGSVAETIMAYADTHKVDMIVIGAFSHARWRELILGGVTKHLVEHSQKPIYMSH